MKHQLKYLKLFEGLTPEEIPYSRTIESKLGINIRVPITELPDIYNQITDDVPGGIEILGQSELVSIDSFHNMTGETFYVNISGNRELNYIKGFNKITKTQSVNIDFNDKLKSIDALNNLEEINKIHLSSNGKLTDINVFKNLNKIGKRLNFSNNDSVTDLNGFNNLYSIGNALEGELQITNNKSLETITGFKNLIFSGAINISKNDSLINIPSFNELKHVSDLLKISDNNSLVEITGFQTIMTINPQLVIGNNFHLIHASIPKSIIKAVKYDDEGYNIIADSVNYYNSPEEFINSDWIIRDIYKKFDPDIHSDQVVKQIVENVYEWGTEETKEKVYKHLMSELPEEKINLIPDDWFHLYHPDYKSTSGRDVAKLNTGQIYGIF